MLIRHCPRCRSDFQPHITACLDCGGPTVERDDEDEVLPPAPAAPEPDEEEEDDWDDDEDGTPERAPAIPFEAEVAMIRRADLDWIQDLAAALAERDIPVRIDPLPGDGRNFALFVRIEDRAAAAAVDRELYLAGLPEELPALPEERAGACPACGTDVPAGQEECPECGLVVAGPDEGEDEESKGDNL